MKKLLLVSALGLVVSAQAYAAGSTVKNSKLVNKATIKNSLNAAIGKKSEANMGTIKVKNSTVKNSKVVNKANIKNSLNAAIGKKSEANMGSIVIE